jgi:competence protein ComEA
MPARPTPSAAALRRLELLTAELAQVRASAPREDEPDDGPVTIPAAGEGLTPATIPVPGRHAARLPAPPPRWSLPIQTPHLAGLAVLVALALLLGAWWVVRSGGEGSPVAPLATVAGLATPDASGPPSVSPSASSSVVVDVTGAVRKPGIVVLDLGARVVDALEAAGGARRGVDLSALNQARLLVDGEQIVVGRNAPAGIAASASAASVPATPLVNLNTATEAELESLPGVGPVTAQSILDWRTSNGRFNSVEELLEVDGIGDATLADLAPYVTL